MQVTPQMRAEVDAAADAAGIKTSEWIRRVLRAALDAEKARGAHRGGGS